MLSPVVPAHNDPVRNLSSQGHFFRPSCRENALSIYLSLGEWSSSDFSGVATKFLRPEKPFSGSRDVRRCVLRKAEVLAKKFTRLYLSDSTLHRVSRPAISDATAAQCGA
jgi:hypothetical protein